MSLKKQESCLKRELVICMSDTPAFYSTKPPINFHSFGRAPFNRISVFLRSSCKAMKSSDKIALDTAEANSISTAASYCSISLCLAR